LEKTKAAAPIPTINKTTTRINMVFSEPCSSLKATKKKKKKKKKTFQNKQT
jgi:hypothetical protein